MWQSRAALCWPWWTDWLWKCSLQQEMSPLKISVSKQANRSCLTVTSYQYSGLPLIWPSVLIREVAFNYLRDELALGSTFWKWPDYRSDSFQGSRNSLSSIPIIQVRWPKRAVNFHFQLCSFPFTIKGISDQGHFQFPAIHIIGMNCGAKPCIFLPPSV